MSVACEVMDDMKQYHEDSRCGSCAGPLEVTRDAICETCAPDPTRPRSARWKRLPIIRHFRYFWHAYWLNRWWRTVGCQFGLFINPYDIEYLKWIWQGKV